MNKTIRLVHHQIKTVTSWPLVGISLLSLVIYLFFLMVPLSLESGNPLWVLLGRFHPLILHFPIVLILLVTAGIILAQLKPGIIHPSVIRAILGVSVVASLFAIGAGYVLYLSEDYSGPLVSNHFYGALVTGSCLSIATIFYELRLVSDQVSRAFFFGFLILTNASLAYTSHLGGSLTHGEYYLSEPINSLLPAKKSDKAPEDMLLYSDIVATILETRCANCHNENKSKGDLLLTSHSALLEAGKSEKTAVIPGDPNGSELMVRILLPEDHDDRMPPEGKPGLTESEISVLRFWIETGASEEMTKGEIQDKPVLAELEQMMPEIQQAQYKILEEKEAFDEALKELQGMASDRGIEIVPDELANGDYFGLKMKFPPSPFGGRELQEFSGYFPHFSRVSLASSDVTDDDLYYLGKMTQLRRLVLQKTAIEGDGLPYLKDLPLLEELNLSFTLLDDASLLHLLSFPSLKKVYLFGTSLNDEVIEAVQKHRPDLEIILEEGPFY
ncbi:c-type cytochrome domain-containing protein [Cyclobacterium jeungdonense]|uniref:C-type cytochrome domain-containing protein n=1 Tax=Cyclobacterium jeungdonense TaxID=708087 RepID=A0ABT8CBT9_9BACT|nr:c-type cytochrome domain-containing protein [Cyclobacterium jeungdonense]MDN3689414.1 c-type cytochrome domain-containing protein [Cyclobacterium jeungdonense]